MMEPGRGPVKQRRKMGIESKFFEEADDRDASSNSARVFTNATWALQITVTIIYQSGDGEVPIVKHIPGEELCRVCLGWGDEQPVS